MSQVHTAYFIGDGAAVYLPFGFTPHFAMLVLWGADNAVDFYYYWKQIEDNGAAACKGGVLVNEGATDVVASGSGLAAYNTSANGPTVTEWSAGATVVARTSTAHGTYYRPTRTGGKGDYSAIFEDVAGTTTGSAEPTWPKDPGGQVADNNVTWERVDGDVALGRVGYEGLAIDLAISDSVECTVLAIDADMDWNWGDIVGWTDGIYGK